MVRHSSKWNYNLNNFKTNNSENFAGTSRLYSVIQVRFYTQFQTWILPSTQAAYQRRVARKSIITSEAFQMFLVVCRNTIYKIKFKSWMLPSEFIDIGAWARNFWALFHSIFLQGIYHPQYSPCDFICARIQLFCLQMVWNGPLVQYNRNNCTTYGSIEAS